MEYYLYLCFLGALVYLLGFESSYHCSDFFEDLELCVFVIVF